MFSTSTSEAH